MPQLATLRLAKIKTLASLDRRSLHAARTQRVSNADEVVATASPTR